MTPRCPFCHAGIEVRASAVACARCGTAHHAECWRENARCTIAGCDETATRPVAALPATQRAFAVTKRVVGGVYGTRARERLGGKTTVALFLGSLAIVGVGVGPLLYGLEAPLAVDLGVVLGATFGVLATWIAALLYQGTEIVDDVKVEVGKGNVFDTNVDGVVERLGSDGSSGGRRPLVHAHGTIGQQAARGVGGPAGILVLLFAILFVFPVLAWIAIHVLLPILVIVVYGTLYHALAYAVNGHPALQGRIGASLARGLAFAALYTGAIVATGAAAVFAVKWHAAGTFFWWS